MKHLVMSVCYPLTETEILLGFKLVRLGAGLWNGFGGRRENRESLYHLAARELLEESGLTALTLARCGIIRVTHEHMPQTVIELHFFLCGSFAGTPEETVEMYPQWFPRTALPFEKMWPIDQHLLPLFLSGTRIIGEAQYSEDRELLRFNFSTVRQLPP